MFTLINPKPSSTITIAVANAKTAIVFMLTPRLKRMSRDHKLNVIISSIELKAITLPLRY
jgi:hypothetical protein